ncbi:3-deoxy-manno-octulosonate cytidylyltransferase [Thecamonas trahens ATCC 50062]|uniref:3-deoxy-manno-octulosonate cytidylyltransferase n=1 Tax=Thecamonas trahens ATCC 50062 TaxID=461836 RepID=A0A0L0D3E2_THETB|nr:3-deoxy-manno-octulosonate cytidylyltransferase [Thecamonas trahens ATCC 50062]KNC46700.1 3-deoxy-manno-octulosonate cytidylyltransferase [Thecamonas trahens ATCC 50062]|eukprot:XP_013760466.1 3-deoxy-manno-octulosonate cytidylyltransferase [Thecamonas trahens ATCC 50062]
MRSLARAFTTATVSRATSHAPLHETESSASSALAAALRVVAVIPARAGSTRLPNKPLANLTPDLETKWTVIDAVVSAAMDAGELDDVIVATDSPDIAAAADAAGAHAVLTPADLPTGSDRVHHALRQLHASRHPSVRSLAGVVNLQGDEPFVDPHLIDALAAELRAAAAATAHSHASAPDIVTAAVELPDGIAPPDLDMVSVVVDHASRALYFSRAALPAAAPHADTASHPSPPPFLAHLGIYGYTLPALDAFVAAPRPWIEQREMLEQLRALYLGLHIHVVTTTPPNTLFPWPPIAIDTPDDLHRARSWLASRNQPATSGGPAPASITS